MNYCMSCTAMVPKEGMTCSRKCYARWYSSALTRMVEGKVMIEDYDFRPLPIQEQPWYLGEIGAYNELPAS